VDAAGRMQTLITDLLAYSRAGRHDLTLSQVDCNKVMQKVTSALSKTIEAEEARVSWDELPVVAGAEISFMQLFQNLIGNALKFRSSEPPEINVSVINKNNEWVFSVSDNGIGIEPQYKERIFQIFQRLHSRSDYAGTGIGLSICKKIVDNFGGRIWVESESGKGSTFYFTVPIERNQSDK
jgi:light-regulated signal transduction histidine kinase (bacteriophytochrome)